MKNQTCSSWTQTGSFGELPAYIKTNVDGVKTAVAQMTCRRRSRKMRMQWHGHWKECMTIRRSWLTTMSRNSPPLSIALGTIHPKGRERGILAGANVVMPNLSPTEVRKDYLLYDNKICTGDESAQCRRCLEQRMEAIGYRVVTARGDSLVGSETCHAEVG